MHEHGLTFDQIDAMTISEISLWMERQGGRGVEPDADIEAYIVWWQSLPPADRLRAHLGQ